MASSRSPEQLTNFYVIAPRQACEAISHFPRSNYGETMMIISRLSPVRGERSILETVINRLEAYVPATGAGKQRVVAICNKIKLIPTRFEIDALRIASRRLPLLLLPSRST